MEAAVKWADKWGMSFNVSKFSCLYFGRSNPCDVFCANGEAIPSGNVQGVRDLGVIISSDLKSSLHVASIVRKASAMMGFIFRSFRFLDTEGYLALYYAFVRSVLEYCSSAWNPFLKRDIQLIEGVQRRFTRRINGLRNLSYNERMSAEVQVAVAGKQCGRSTRYLLWVLSSNTACPCGIVSTALIADEE